MSWSIAAAMGGALPALRLNETIRGVRGAAHEDRIAIAQKVIESQ
jgi:hypothetical protein